MQKIIFLFRMLAGYVEFDGYYLESDPCLVCNNPEVPFSVRRVSCLQVISVEKHVGFIIRDSLE